MAETKPIPVRLDETILTRLDKAADRIGNNRAGIIRLLINSWLDDFERKGMAVLPPDWENLIVAQDHRTRASKGLYPMPATEPIAMNESANSASQAAKHLLGSIANAGLSAAQQRAASKRRQKDKAHRTTKAAPPGEADQNR